MKIVISWFPDAMAALRMLVATSVQYELELCLLHESRNKVLMWGLGKCKGAEAYFRCRLLLRF